MNSKLKPEVVQLPINILDTLLAYQAFDPYLLEGIEDSDYKGREDRPLPDFEKLSSISGLGQKSNIISQLGGFYFYHRSPYDTPSYNSTRMAAFRDLIYIPFCQALQEIAGLTYDYHELRVLGIFSEKRLSLEHVLLFFQNFFQTKEIDVLKQIMEKVRRYFSLQKKE